MKSMADLRMEVSLYLGRSVPSHEQIEQSLSDVMEKARMDQGDAEAYRMLKELHRDG